MFVNFGANCAGGALKQNCRIQCMTYSNLWPVLVLEQLLRGINKLFDRPSWFLSFLEERYGTESEPDFAAT